MTGAMNSYYSGWRGVDDNDRLVFLFCRHQLRDDVIERPQFRRGRGRWVRNYRIGDHLCRRDMEKVRDLDHHFPGRDGQCRVGDSWLFVETTSRIADAIACDHDLASGIRLAAFLLGSSGRSVEAWREFSILARHMA